MSFLVNIEPFMGNNLYLISMYSFIEFYKLALRVVYPLELPPPPPNPPWIEHYQSTWDSPNLKAGSTIWAFISQFKQRPWNLWVKLHDRENCAHHKTPTAQVFLVGVMYAPILKFKTGHLAYWGGSHVTVSISLLYLHFSLLLSQFQTIFASFVNVNVSRACCVSEF